MQTKRPVALFMLGAAVASIALSTGNVRAQDAQRRVPTTHLMLNGVVGPLTDYPDAPVSAGTYKHPPSPICTTNTQLTADVNTDCENAGPHNETTIAINPTNPLNRIASANDYQFGLTPGGHFMETNFPRAHVTFDGGQTWTTYSVPFNGYTVAADPAISFDANGTAYYSTLGLVFSQGLRGWGITDYDVLVAHSTDGGQTWSTVRVSNDPGGGRGFSGGHWNDKGYLTAWGNGNAIVTWTVFTSDVHTKYSSSPIYASVTHDGGKTWSAPTQISGSASFCAGAQGGNACDQDQASVPVVASDGSIYAAFINLAHPLTSGRDQYLVVKVDPNTGTRVGGPYKVADIVDGYTDYPINVAGRPTYQDSQFRTASIGNVTADPTNALHLAVVWSDMRNSTLPAPSDPYSAKTNSDIVISQSFDGGVTWSVPTAILTPGDQFMPWGVYDSDGKLRIGYFDRSFDAANHKYGYTLATETSPGSLTFTTSQLTTTLSDPTMGNTWFSVTVNNSFPNATLFLGDYSNIAASGGAVAALWTDMRNNTCFDICGASQDSFYASVP